MVAHAAGADDFVCLMDDADANTLHNVAQRLLAAEREPIDFGDRRVMAACSIGVAVFPDDGASPEALFERADRAMYGIKSW